MYKRLRGGLMLRLTTPVDKNVRWRLPTKPLQVEQPLVEVMSKDHARMIRGCLQTALILIRKKV
jgi:hypothetical protein